MLLQLLSRRIAPTVPRHLAAATFTIATQLRVEIPNPFTPPAPQAATTPKPKQTPIIDAPRSYGRKVDSFTPQPLPRPIGLLFPPRPGQNTGIDKRTLLQKRDDMTNWDKHLERRERLKNQISRPYFRDWINTKFHDGKSFIAPIRVFRAEKSLFFPNLFGKTLEKSEKEVDTTPVLTGKVSVVTIMSGHWAEKQIDTWISETQNPALKKVLQNNPDAQVVRVNYEENSVKAWIINICLGSLRRTFPKADWNKYFVVRRGINDDMRENIGYLNSKVGYIYIVDHECRIRWAGSGPAHPVEQESLVRGVQRVVSELKENRAALAPKVASKSAGKK